ncbi:MAG TPA: GNAT family N-acetyltransferase [Longimicrobium sp.]|jgi:GNAT superfamily N-acetyltransferase
MTTPRIRPATPADVPALVALMAAFYAESDYPLPADRARAAFAALLADGRLGGVWIAGDDGADPDGYAVLTVGYSMEYGGMRGFVDDLFVRPAARGAGVASALLRAARQECVARGVRALHVEVGPENGVALRTYARAGFAESGHLLLTLPLADPVHVAG